MLPRLHIHIEANASYFNNSNSSRQQGFGHSLKSSVAATIAAYFILLIIGGIVFNVVLIHAILLKKRLHSTSVSFIEQQQSTTNTFVVNLAVCDLLTAISTIPFDADFLLRGYYSGGLFICGLKETFFMFSLPASIVNLLLLTGERFVKLLYPFKHGILYTKLNVAVLILASWTYILIIALLPIMMDSNAVVIEDGICALHFSTSYTVYQLVGNFSLPIVVILAMNTVLYYNVGKRARHMKKHKNSIKRARLTRSGSTTKWRQSIVTLPINFKAAKTIMSLVGVFLICWLTFIISVTINILCGVCLPREVTWIVNAINYSSVALNPVIYGLLNKSIRQMLLKTYFKCYGDKLRANLSYRFYSLNSSHQHKNRSSLSITSDIQIDSNHFKKRDVSHSNSIDLCNGKHNQHETIKNSISDGMQYLSVQSKNSTSTDVVFKQEKVQPGDGDRTTDMLMMRDNETVL